MRRQRLLTALVLTLSGAVLVACGGNGGGDLKEVQKQRAGEYVVTVLADDGKVREGNNDFVLEFRRASDNQLVDVGAVQLNSSMPMPGMPNMVAEMSASPSGTPGRYDVDSTFQMRGAYATTVTFATGQRAQFTLNVQ